MKRGVASHDVRHVRTHDTQKGGKRREKTKYMKYMIWSWYYLVAEYILGQVNKDFPPSTTFIMPRNDSESQASVVEREEHVSNADRRKLWVFLGTLLLDAIFSVLILTPFINALWRPLNETTHYTLYGSLYDLSLLAAARLIAACLGLLVAYASGFDPPEFPFPT